MTRPCRASAGAWGLAFAILVLLASSPPSGADPGDEGALYVQTTAVRTARRVGAVVRSAELDGIARRHAQRLAASTGPAFHNPNLQAEAAGWQAVGEVVGRITVGPGWDSGLMQLWLSSPVHRQVVLSGAFTAVGIGTARSPSGAISAVEVFGRGAGAARAPRASRQQAAPAPARPARPVASTTSAPPPTTTTTAPPPPTTTTSPPTTIAASGLPSLVIAAAPTTPQPRGLADVAATAGLLGCCVGLQRVVRRRPKG